MKHVLFISDLHLNATNKHLSTLFMQFLSRQAIETEALYILGDLFEAWVGDDDNNAFIQSIISALRELSQHIPVYLLNGNRDFLLGKKFAEASGCQQLFDPTVIDLYGVPTLLMHGDSLCTQDTAYQYWRRFAHNPILQKLFLTLPLKLRQSVADYMRNRSKGHSYKSHSPKFDIVLETMLEAMKTHGVKQLIHGHTHRPSIHYFLLDGQLARHLVLSDWHEQGNVLICTPNQEYRLIYI